MKTVVCETFGPPESLKIVEQPAPQPGPLDVQVDVRAAGVGFVDGLMIQGRYQVKPKLPYYPGAEFAGIVTALGGEITEFDVGDRIFGLAGGGAFADVVCARAAACCRIPSAMDDATAAGLYINYATALYGLRNCGRFVAGETLLVLGAAGGVGSAAIAVAKALDARVIAAASTELKRAEALRNGADAVVDYSQENWRAEVAELTADSGLQGVYDPVGGEASELAFRCLSPGGRHLVVGFASGTIPKIPLNLPLLKQSSVVGVDWGGAMRADPGLNGPLMATLVDWYAAGRLIPSRVVSRSMGEVSTALAAQLAGEIPGKLVLLRDDLWAGTSVQDEAFANTD